MEGGEVLVFEKLCELIAEQFGVDADEITVDTSFADDLGADSLDIVELTMAIEEEFEVGELGEDDLADVKTVGDIVELINQNKNK